MKKISMLLMLLCITLGANAQLLWKISGKDLPKPSYVFGTHHLAPLSITDSIAGFRQALNQVEQVYGEIVMEDMTQAANLQKMQQAILLPGDTTLHTLFTPAQYDSLAATVKTLMGADLKMFDNIRPAFLSTQISVLLAMKTVQGFDPKQQLDSWVQAEARKMGKAVGGLETMDFQMGILFGSQSLKRQAEQLYCSIQHLDLMEQQTVKMTAAYMQQKLDVLEKVITEKMGNVCDALPEEEEVLIYGRNSNWAQAMPAIMKQKSTLFAVGSGHLTSQRGLLQLLRNEGYKVEAVR